jgi:Ca-activated chloride channel family protein
MHLRNKRAAGLFVFLILATGTFLHSQGQPDRAQSQQKQQPTQPTALPADVDPADPALPVWARPAASTATAPAPDVNKSPGHVPSVQQPAPEGRVGEVTKSGGTYVYRQQVDEVTLQAAVIDQRRHFVTQLSQANFVILEDGRPQKIASFRQEDIPVSLGIVVDNSGSMRSKRSAVTKAVVNLVQASNPQDEVFIVNFNDDSWLDQDFTNKVELLREALDRVDSRGSTALYDAVLASADHLAKGAKREKRVLLVVTDGLDNLSHHSLEQAIRAVQEDNGPMIYTIGILDDVGSQRRAKRALQSLSDQTGGVAFFPKTLEEVDEVSQEVAQDIRNQYRITYKPTNPRSNGGYRAVKVEAHAPGYKDLQVRTRSGYFANEQRTASTGPASR